MTVPTLKTLKVKLFTDGADKAQIVQMAKQPWIGGFTTNPSLLKKAGVGDYSAFGRDLVAAVERLSPDVIVSDISMPGLDGIEAATAILHKNPAARIVLVSVHCDPILAQRGFEVGVLGYVPKSAAGDELVPAVHSALRGEHHVSPLLKARRSTRTP